MSRRTSRSGAVTLALLLLPGLSLVGCSSDDDPGQDPGAVLESPTGTGEVPDPEALPDGYPEAEAPLIEGEIVSATDGDAEAGKSFSILVAPETDITSALDDAIARFVEKGWKDNTPGTSTTHVLVKGADTAVLEAIDDEGDGLVSYNVVTQ